LRIWKISIGHWRHFQNIDLNLDINAKLVCVVGANGTGKSHILELIAACAHRLGLSQGIEIPRGDPFSDIHDFSLQFYLAPGVSNAVDHGLAQVAQFAAWNRTLTIQSHRAANNESVRITAGGIEDPRQSVEFATQIVRALRGSEEVHFLSLDADRAYPKRNVNIHEIAQAYEIDWDTTEYTRGRSFKTTTTLYDEWIKYFLAQENQAGTRLIQETRRARENARVDPVFRDHFAPYEEALRKVLPHLLFTGVDPKSRTLIFDTTGLALSFNQLSGGEREIAFLVGQIDRFGLRQGIFLLDEPELHLNADLIRNWVGYLTGTVQTGQIWLATHSLEAVEAAGQQSTFVLERNEETRKVDSIARLDARPVLSALSRAVGTPAFSISKLLFVFIEGEEGVGERERFRKLAGLPQSVRFIECGSCNEVIRRVSSIRSIAREANTEIRVGGVVDRDFRSDIASTALSREHGVFVLPVHEAENFFLHPETLNLLLVQNGRGDIDPLETIRTATDARAGSWIFQHAMATRNARGLAEISQRAKDSAKRLSWIEVTVDRDARVQEIVDRSGYDIEGRRQLKDILLISIDAYERKRQDISLWKVCEGKQVLNDVARAIGFADAPAMSLASFVAWSREGAVLPGDLMSFREYLNAL